MLREKSKATHIAFGWRNFLPIVLLILISGAETVLASGNSRFSLRRVSDSILALDTYQQVTWVEVTKTKPIYVYAITCKTLPFSQQSVRNVLCDMKQYKFSTIMTRIDFLGLEPAQLRRPVYFVEAAGSLMAAALWLGLFDTSGIDPQSGSTIRFEHYADSVLFKSCKKKSNGLIQIKPRDFSLGWRLRQINQDTTRVELICRLSLNMWIPQWLYSLTASILYPGIVQDLEKYLKKNSQNLRG